MVDQSKMWQAQNALSGARAACGTYQKNLRLAIVRGADVQPATDRLKAQEHVVVDLQKQVASLKLEMAEANNPSETLLAVRQQLDSERAHLGREHRDLRTAISNRSGADNVAAAEMAVTSRQETIACLEDLAAQLTLKTPAGQQTEAQKVTTKKQAKALEAVHTSAALVVKGLETFSKLVADYNQALVTAHGLVPSDVKSQLSASRVYLAEVLTLIGKQAHGLSSPSLTQRTAELTARIISALPTVEQGQP